MIVTNRGFTKFYKMDQFQINIQTNLKRVEEK